MFLYIYIEGGARGAQCAREAGAREGGARHAASAERQGGGGGGAEGRRERGSAHVSTPHTKRARALSSA